MKVKGRCEYCGKEFFRWKHEIKEHMWCSAACHMRQMNAELNPTRFENGSISREKLRNRQLGDELKSYRKYYGRHEHRVVAEQMLGRPLKRGEIVHHINGDKSDNRPENLMVFSSQAEHAKYHADHDGFGKGKTVICLDTGEKFKSTKEAARKVGVSQSSISAACRGDRKHAAGMRWSYEREGVSA